MISRRDFLRISGLSGTLAALAACKPFSGEERLGSNPKELARGGTVTPIPIVDKQGMLLHTLRRATFGPTAAELESAKQVGLEGWLEQQLSPDAFDHRDVDDRLNRLETLQMSPAELRDLQENGRVARELVTGAVIRQIFSPAQLYEVMVDLWTNHFNIHAFSPPELFLKAQDDREVIRPHALGSFPEMLRASAHSPAMLVYLDNAHSRQPSPNENYARELLELHSLGVDGGYTYNDIQAVARAFTGWSVGGFRRSADRAGNFAYLPAWHDPDPKTALGQQLPGGKGDGDRVLEILAEHPSTARFIGFKLSRRFVSDEPPASLVDTLAATYAQTNGNISAMLRTLFYSDEFATSAGLKLKRPLEFAISTIRVTGADGRLDRILRFFLEVLGQVPYGWPAPDGYPDYASAWANTNQSLYRWNLALMTASSMLPGISTDLPFGHAPSPDLVDDLSHYLLGMTLPDEPRQILVDFGESLSSADLPGDMEPSALLAGLVLCTPQFQLR